MLRRETVPSGLLSTLSFPAAPATLDQNPDTLVSLLRIQFPLIDTSYLRQMIGIFPFNIALSRELGSVLEKMNGDYPRITVSEDPNPSDYEKYLEATEMDDISYRNVSASYITNLYPNIETLLLLQIFRENNFRLLKTVLYIDQNIEIDGDTFSILEFKGKFITGNRKPQIPGVPSDAFLEELSFIEKIHSRYIKRQEIVRQYNEAGGTFVTCPICYEDKPYDDVVQCSEMHILCKQCTHDYIISQLDSQADPFICGAEPGCEGTYVEGVILMVLSEEERERLDKNAQQKIISMMENIVSCPFCEALIDTEGFDSTEIVCPNQNCRVKFCRLCQQKIEDEHNCPRLEAPSFVAEYQNCLSEALITNCPKCKVPVQKSVGCNKMTCPRCKTNFCFRCGIDLPSNDAYAHFTEAGQQEETGKCPMYSNEEKDRMERLTRAREQFIQEWTRNHPDQPLDQQKMKDIDRQFEIGERPEEEKKVDNFLFHVVDFFKQPMQYVNLVRRRQRQAARPAAQPPPDPD